MQNRKQMSTPKRMSTRNEGKIKMCSGKGKGHLLPADFATRNA